MNRATYEGTRGGNGPNGSMYNVRREEDVCVCVCTFSMLHLSGMTSIQRYPFTAAAMARAVPVQREEGDTEHIHSGTSVHHHPIHSSHPSPLTNTHTHRHTERIGEDTEHRHRKFLIGSVNQTTKTLVSLLPVVKGEVQAVSLNQVQPPPLLQS